MNFVDIYQRYWKNGYVLTDQTLSGIDREMFRSLFNPVAEVFRKYPAGDCHLYVFGPGGYQQQGMQPGNYFDSAGTTHASVDGSVGMVLDAAGSVGANLLSDPSSWTPGSGVSVNTATGVVTYNGSESGYNTLTISSPATSDKWYQCSFTVSGYTQGQLGFGTGAIPTAFASSNGNFTTTFKATASNPVGLVDNGGAGARFAGVVSNISIREVTGIHATQTTPGFKPTLRRGIVNLLTYSNDLTGSGGWFPNGAEVTKQGDECVISSVGNDPMVFKGFDVVAGRGYTLAVKVKAVGATIGKPAELWNYMAGSATGPVVSNIFTLGSDYEIQVVNFTPTGSGSVYFRFDAPSSSAIAGDTVYVDGCGLFAGTLTAAQILAAGGIPMTTTAPVSSVAGVNYLEFGGDDYMALGSSPFAFTDDWCVVCAASCNVNDSSVGGVFANCQTADYNGMYLGFFKGKPIVSLASGGFSDLIQPPSYVLATPVVITAWKVGNTIQVRVNSSLVQETTRAWAAVPAINAYTIGSIGPAFNLNGNIYAVLPEKGTLTLADVQLLEKQATAGIQL